MNNMRARHQALVLYTADEDGAPQYAGLAFPPRSVLDQPLKLPKDVHICSGSHPVRPHALYILMYTENHNSVEVPNPAFKKMASILEGRTVLVVDDNHRNEASIGVYDSYRNKALAVAADGNVVRAYGFGNPASIEYWYRHYGVNEQ